MEVSLIRQFSAVAASTANSTAFRLRTGNAPGKPRQTGQTLVLGGLPKWVEQEQKILVAVRSWTCTSSPMSGSYLARAATDVSGVVTISGDYSAHLWRGDDHFGLAGALRYFSSGTSKYISSLPLASRTPVR